MIHPISKPLLKWNNPLQLKIVEYKNNHICNLDKSNSKSIHQNQFSTPHNKIHIKYKNLPKHEK